MYQYIFDEDTTNKLKTTTAKTKAIFDQFGAIDNKYNTLAKGENELNLEKMNYSKPTDEEISKKAKDSLQEYKTSGIDSINNEYLEKQEQANKSISNLKEDLKNQTNNIISAYDNVKEEAKEDAIKRGLARSSIIVNTLAKHDQQMLNELSEKAKQINEKIDAYNGDLALLQTQKQNALNAFDIAYAVKLQEKIDGINEEVYKNEQDVIKYNNQIAQIQAEWDKKNNDDNFDKTTSLAELIGKYGSAIFDVLKQNEKLEIAKNYFAQMSKEDAINELKNNSAFINQLGNKNYNKLLEELQLK